MGWWVRRVLAVYAFFVLVVVVDPDLVLPRARGCGGGSRIRACFANQKTIAGAIEMYSLDFETRVERLDPAVLGKLKEAGYLQSIPNDPGSSRTDTYLRLGPDGGSDGIFCLVHGAIRPKTPGTSPRRQLEDWGFTDPGLLAQAADALPPPESLPRPDNPLELALGLTLAVFVLLVGVPLGVVLALHLGLVSSLGLLGLVAVGVELSLVLRWWKGRARAAVPGPGQGAAGEAGAGETPVDLARARCPVCAEGFRRGSRAACCPRCRTPHHEDCLGWLGGCGRYACGGVPGPAAQAAAREEKAAIAGAPPAPPRPAGPRWLPRP